ncbi:Uncharacterised protein [Klebsiella pneumoniae]|nr:Uncharacterised protein [Klebsiella pneumoniae]SXC00732.1 Uncharacterised protein [Klebsiella pneumoniae]SXC00739.1 Uncharacterised protein [Klebsiella pneumoniae]
MVSFEIVLSIQDSTKILLFVIIKASHPKFLNLQLMAAVQVLAVAAPMVVPVGAMEAPVGAPMVETQEAVTEAVLAEAQEPEISIMTVWLRPTRTL